MICDAHKGNYSYEELSELCSVTSEGVSMLGIYKVAKQIGFLPECRKVSLEQLVESSVPCILHWNQKHFVVLYKCSKKGVFYVADPSKGLVKYKKKEFEEHWLSFETGENHYGLAMFLKPSSMFYNKNREQRKKRSFGFLLSYILRYKGYFTVVVGTVASSCVLQLIMPFLTQSIVDIGISHKNIDFIVLILIGEFAIVLGKMAADFVRRWIILHISMRINISLISDFFSKLLKLPMSFFETKLLGDILQRIDDHSRVQSFFTSQLLGVMFSILNFMVFGFVLLIYNTVIFCVFFLWSIIYGLWISSFLRRRKILDYDLFEQQSINRNHTYQFITSMQEIKLQGCEQRRRWEWEDTQADLFSVQIKSLKMQQQQEAGSIFINEIKNVVITVLAAMAVINGQITIGAMLAIQYIVGQLNSPVEQLMSFIYSLQDVKISLERICEIHEGKDEDATEELVKSFDSEKTIRINHINFKYDLHALKNTIENVSLDIPEGKVTAIVGASGSGKTTLIKLMLGYYHVATGSIFIAGRNINEYNLRWWRCRCGVVMQDGVIFSESIARNIAVGDEELDVERLEQAAKVARIHDYVMGLPLKYSTKVGRDGIGLSQGQKQRILIARAVYKNPDFIFLDEATNALDSKNEREIVDELNDFYKGRTVVIVAHRLSTVKNADQIVVIDQGKIVEKGNHRSLIERKGAYYNLIKNQLELGV
jgi:ATP-binding cassette subfamily B protein